MSAGTARARLAPGQLALTRVRDLTRSHTGSSAVAAEEAALEAALGGKLGGQPGLTRTLSRAQTATLRASSRLEPAMLRALSFAVNVGSLSAVCEGEGSDGGGATHPDGDGLGLEAAEAGDAQRPTDLELADAPEPHHVPDFSQRHTQSSTYAYYFTSLAAIGFMVAAAVMDSRWGTAATIRANVWFA